MVLGQDEAHRRGRAPGLQGLRTGSPAGRQRPERDAARRPGPAAPRRGRAGSARTRPRAAGAHRRVRAARGRGAIAPARGGHGRRGHRGDDPVPTGLALVCPVSGGRGDARPESARLWRSRMAAVVRGGGRNPDPGAAAAARAPLDRRGGPVIAEAGVGAGLGRRPRRGRRADHLGHGRHRAPARASLRRGVARRSAGQPPGPSGGRARDVAGHAEGRPRPAGARRPCRRRGARGRLGRSPRFR